MKPAEIYQYVTDQIVAQLEEAQLGEWRCPWVSRFGGMPHNPLTNKAYSGVNVLLLWAKRYPSNMWAGLKQWNKEGAKVRKGEKATKIVRYFHIEKEQEDGSKRDLYLPKILNVFNVAQVDGWKGSAKHKLPDKARIIEQVEQFTKATSARIQETLDRAYYNPSEDYIGMPQRKAFHETQGYYSTLLHELTHWTGHESRCNREFGKRFGNEKYAFEELVAELGSAFLCASLHVENEPRKDHAQYLSHWLKVLKNDNKAIFTAAREANKAVEHLNELQTA